MQLLCVLSIMNRLFSQPPRIDAGLFFLRLAGCLLLLHVHGLPKVFHFSEELTRIEDPFGLGPSMSLLPAIFAEVICPIFILTGVFARLACLPIIGVLLVAMVFVHPDWSIAEGQFGWLLLIIFATLAITGPGKWRPGADMQKGVRHDAG
ncbi:MAG: LysR family transcriptional regulator [Pantoea eucrina]|jgi:putative oxidoreductase|nr:LysR family transcriptional regulator [Pantoea eucrina]